MSKQENGCSRREKLKMRLGFMRSRRVLAGIAAALMGASLVFTSNALAQKESLMASARRRADYIGQRKVYYSGLNARPYKSYTKVCKQVGSSIVYCTLQYYDQSADPARNIVPACTETIYFTRCCIRWATATPENKCVRE